MLGTVAQCTKEQSFVGPPVLEMSALPYWQQGGGEGGEAGKKGKLEKEADLTAISCN